MTRRDYVRIAAALAEAAESHITANGSGDPYRDALGGTQEERAAFSMGQSLAWERCVDRIADALAADNPRFDRDRFSRAASSVQAAIAAGAR
jgi:hypothetical protein